MMVCLIIVIIISGIVMPEITAAQLDNYSSISQYISELGEKNAPLQLFVNTSLFVTVGFAILLLVYLIDLKFGDQHNDQTKKAIWLLYLPGVAYIGSALFPCQPGCPLMTTDPVQIIHNFLGLLEYSGAVWGIAIWAKWFKNYEVKIYTVFFQTSVFFIFIGFIGMIIPYLSEYRGLLQRMADYSFFLSLSLLAVYIIVHDRK